MMDNLEYIDDYFNTSKDTERTRLFEQRIREDAGFAADLAFYLSARKTAAENQEAEGRNRFRELYEATRTLKPARTRIIPVFVRWVAAAAILAAVVLGVFISQKRESPRELANRYISTEMQTLGVTMGKEDELQKGISFYNQKKYSEALTIFEKLIRSDSNNVQALENAGKACIQLGNYDKALSYLNSMEQLKPYGNPEKFYEALALIARNQTGDLDKAKSILQEIVKQDWDNKETAEKWLHKW